ncbi:NAD(P)H-dependent flavin oxidoreductase [Paenibacillus sp. WLX1005]|uniref:NAD(P)H-dependent flavin oxidoreductase n=1 Tax=Paenibacillus sp. WLX1005 TaxID=3243766 RepID=UPI0039845CA6
MHTSASNSLCQRLGIRYPIILAGMAGIPNMALLVAAVSNAGGLGTLGAAYMEPEQLHTAIQEIRTFTSLPFAVNVFAHIGEDDYTNFETVNDQLQATRDELGIPRPTQKQIHTRQILEEQLDILIRQKVPVISTTFGLLSESQMELIHSAGIQVMATATTVNEAIQAEQSGCHYVVAQGSEAGGHRGTFDLSSTDLGANIGSIALIPQIVDHVRIPVIAAGGIMDGRGLVAALALGAQGVQLGTRFLTASESGAHPAYQQALLNSTEESTVLTHSFSGRPARGVSNTFIQQWNAGGLPPLSFPTQNSLTRDIRNAAAQQNRSEYMALWAGQGTRMLSSNQSASDIIQQIIHEANQVKERL